MLEAHLIDERSECEIRGRLERGLVPRLRRLRWPRYMVAKRFLDHLHGNPSILQWCSGAPSNVEIVIDALKRVEKCLAKKTRAIKSRHSNVQERQCVQQGASLGSGSFEVFWNGFLPTGWYQWRHRQPSNHVRHELNECFREAFSGIRQTVEGLSSIVSTLSQLGFDGCGWDLSPNSMSSADIERILDIERELRRNKSLIRICEQLGKMELTLNSDPSANITSLVDSLFELRLVRQKCKRSGIPHSVRGIEYTDDLENMLASELSLLGDPELESLWYAKFAEGQLETYKSVGNEIRQKPRKTPTSASSDALGPFIALVDCSYSMKGQPLYISKAITLGMCKLAFRQRRDVYLIKFSSAPVDRHVLSFDARGVQRLFEFLLDSYGGGGTDIDTPLKDAARLIESDPRWERSDVVIMSDGDFYVGDDAKRRIDKVKAKKGLRVTGIVTGGNRGPFENLCSPGKLYSVEELDMF